jgi:uncharacterized membrane protein (DUF373 family)
VDELMSRSLRKESGNIAKLMISYGRALVIIVEIIVVVFITALIILSTYYTAKDLLLAFAGNSSKSIPLLLNDIFLLVIYVELIRSIVVGYRMPEMYLVSIAEVGFIVIVREIIASVISTNFISTAVISAAALMFAFILWIFYTKVMPSKKSTASSTLKR